MSRLTKEEAFGAYDIHVDPEIPTPEKLLDHAVSAHSHLSDLVTGLSRDDFDRELLGLARSAEYLLDYLAVQVQISYHSNDQTEDTTRTPGGLLS